MPDYPLTRRQFFGRMVNSVAPDHFLIGGSGGLPVQRSLLPHMDEAGYTPTRFFFSHHSRPIPAIDPLTWSLRLDGLVRNPSNLTLDHLQSLPSSEMSCTIVSAGNAARNTLIGHACWQGVSLKNFLADSMLLPEARFAYLTAADGYTTCLEIERMNTALLAYRMNGETLPPEQGYPIRLIVPGLYSYKMPKWLQRIEFTAEPLPGFWEDNGASISGIVEPMLAIFTPRHLETLNGVVSIAGVAYAGERQIVAVEVSIDDAPWMPVSFNPAPQYSWTPWQIDWTPPSSGDYLIRVRATDSPAVFAPDSLHSVIVRVT